MAAPERVVVVDLSKVDHIDSAGLGAFPILRVSGVYDEPKFIEPGTLNQSNDR
jgi:hypothetical protein